MKYDGEVVCVVPGGGICGACEIEMCYVGVESINKARGHVVIPTLL